MRVDTQTGELFELLERSVDPVIFAEALGIDLNPAQQRWFRLLANGPRWAHKFIVHVAANQIGKTLGLGIIILWACFHKIGMDRSDPGTWLRLQYQWFHLAPSQQQAYLVLRDITLLLDGIHPAQRRKPMLPQGLATAVKVEQYYDGLQLWNGAVVQFRTTEEKAKALQGRRAAGISFDECAFEIYLKTVVNEVLMMRLISTGGPLLLVSTPNGINDYFEIVQQILDTGQAQEDHTWTAGSSALAWSTVTDNVGFGISQAEVDRMERDIDETTREQQLRGAFLEPSEAFFVPAVRTIEAFHPLPELVRPLPGHRYVTMWDPSVASDPTAMITLDVTSEPWTGVNFRHYPRPPAVNQLLLDIESQHALYNSSATGPEMKSSNLTGFDSTSMGGVMLRQQLGHLRPSRAINFGGPRAKMDYLTNLRAALLKGRLVLPESWYRLKRELLNYRLDDKKLQQDCVMALAGAVELASRGFSGKTSRPFQVSGRVAERAPWL